MRRAARFLLACTWTCLLATAAACGDDDDDDDADIDAGTGEDIDAGADIDAEPPPPEPATVTVFDFDGNIAEGIDVVFHDSDGSPIQTIATGKDGKASREVPPNAMITVVVQEDLPAGDGSPTILATLATIVGVQPGDDLVVGFPPEPEPPTFSPGDVLVQMPAAFEDADSYEVSVGCETTVGAPGEQVTINVSDASCLGSDGKVDVLATAFTDGNVSAYSFATDVDFVQGGDTAVVNLPAFAAPTETLEVTFENTPPMTTDSSGELELARDGVPFDGDGGEPDVTLARPLPSGFFDRLVMFFGAGFDGNAESAALREQPVPTAAVTVDLKAALLPRIAGVVVTSQDVERPRVTVVADGDLTGADGAAVQLQYLTDTAQVFWLVMFPTSSTSVQLPALPDALEHLRPTPSSTYPQPGALVVESTLFAGYDAFRNGYQALLTVVSGNLPSLGGDGELRVTIRDFACSAAGGGGAGLGACLAVGVAGLFIRRRRRR